MKKILLGDNSILSEEDSDRIELFPTRRIFFIEFIKYHKFSDILCFFFFFFFFPESF